MPHGSVEPVEREVVEADRDEYSIGAWHGVSDRRFRLNELEEIGDVGSGDHRRHQHHQTYRYALTHERGGEAAERLRHQDETRTIRDGVDHGRRQVRPTQRPILPQRARALAPSP